MSSLLLLCQDPGLPGSSDDQTEGFSKRRKRRTDPVPEPYLEEQQLLQQQPGQAAGGEGIKRLCEHCIFNESYGDYDIIV